MDKEKQISSQGFNSPRSKRVKRIKTGIIVIALILLILPTILCIFLFFKLNYLQKQIDILMVDRYGVTYNSENQTSNETFAHAATVYNSKPDTGTGQNGGQAGDNTISERKGAVPSLEENNTNGYNKETVTDAGKNLISQNNTDSLKDNMAADETASGKVTDTGKDTNTGKDAGTKKDTQEGSAKTSGESGGTDNTTGKKTDPAKAVDTSKKTGSEKKEYKNFDKKTVYLTFDDGPSKYTEDILEVLDDYKVKATFFVIGKTDSHSKEMYKKIVDEGHTLGMHSYSHDYKKIYNSVEDFDKDFTKLRDLLYDTTGYLSSIYRFPGGSSNSVMKEDVSVFINYLNRKSVVYFDWNVVSSDATGVDYTAKQLYQNVINGIKIHNNSIVLMHDTDEKENTVKSLKLILKTLTEQGVEILPLNEEVTPIQQVKVGSIEQTNKK